MNFSLKLKLFELVRKRKIFASSGEYVSNSIFPLVLYAVCILSGHTVRAVSLVTISDTHLFLLRFWFSYLLWDYSHCFFQKWFVSGTASLTHTQFSAHNVLITAKVLTRVPRAEQLEVVLHVFYASNAHNCNPKHIFALHFCFPSTCECCWNTSCAQQHRAAAVTCCFPTVTIDCTIFGIRHDKIIPLKIVQNLTPLGNWCV